MKKFQFLSTIMMAGALVLTGCGDKGSDDDGSSSSSSSTSGSGEEGETGTTEGGTSATTGGTTDGTTGTDTSGFVGGDSMMTCGESCDIWKDNDCGDGEKCTAVGCEVGTSAWDSNICVGVMGSKQLGDDCEYLGTGIDGLDDCDVGMMCWNQDPDTGLGTCIAFCDGSPDAPTCGAGTTCTIANDGVLPICLPGCDPLAQDCEGSNLCIPSTSDDGFVCVLDASGGMSPYGTPCMYANACNPGLMCIVSEAVPEPDCASASYCCSPICDTDATNSCPGTGQECESLYEEGMAPPGYENIGVCAVPTG